jgi:acylpyruvate hydrolase
MKLLAFLTSSGPRLGVVAVDTVIDIHAAIPEVPSDLRAALAVTEELSTRARSSDIARFPLTGNRYAPVVPAPGKTICLGLNYFDHATEGGRDRPDYPWLFLRSSSSLLGHGQPAAFRLSQLDSTSKLSWR